MATHMTPQFQFHNYFFHLDDIPILDDLKGTKHVIRKITKCLNFYARITYSNLENTLTSIINCMHDGWV